VVSAYVRATPFEVGARAREQLVEEVTTRFDHRRRRRGTMVMVWRMIGGHLLDRPSSQESMIGSETRREAGRHSATGQRQALQAAELQSLAPAADAATADRCEVVAQVTGRAVVRAREAAGGGSILAARHRWQPAFKEISARNRL